MFLTSIQFLSMTIYLIRLIQGDFKIPELSYVIAAYVLIIQGLVKFYIILYHKANIQKLILSLGGIWRKEVNLTDIQIQNKNNFLKTLSVGQVVCYWVLLFAIWLNLTISFIITLVRKFIFLQNTELLLTFGSVYIFFDTSDDWTQYIIAYIFQIYIISGLGYMYFGLEFLAITLCAHLCTGFSLLQDDLKRLTPTNNRVDLNEHLQNAPTNTIKIIIKQHQKLIELTKLMNSIFNIIFFANLSLSTFELCFFALACIVAYTPMDFAKNILAILIILPSIFLLCYYSEILRETSGGIAEAAYENVWYRGDVDYRRNIRFIIMRAQRPCSLMSLNYIPITLNTFTKVVSTTYSYLSLAMTMYSKK